MEFLKFVISTCRGMMVFTAITALLSGACNAALIALVNTALNAPQTAAAVLIGSFVALGLGKLITSFVSQALLVRFSQGTIAELRRDLIRKILAVPLRQLEEIGTPRILVALTDDVLNITNGLLSIPVIAVNVAILLGGAAYLGWLSWQILLALFALIVFGSVGYRLLIARGFQALNSAREEEDRLFGHFRALTEGIKELKLHRDRRNVFLSDNIQKTTATFQQHNVTAEIRFILAQHWSHLLFFTLIGLILFLLPAMRNISKEALTGYVITTLYLMGPLAGVLGSFSLFARANISLQKVQKLGISLSSHPAEQWSIAPQQVRPSFECLELVGVTHSYHQEKNDNSFVLGPLDLTLRAGELVFLVGGNGCGKSTLGKIITGLYPPETGQIRLDGAAVNDTNRDDFRQLFSAVFADFYVFESLLGLQGKNLDAQAQDYLIQLHLNHKVRVKNGVLSTTALSQGQRKRLALLTAYLEDRPFYLFDEWASDQDPLFKNIFYTQLLPELKARGKTVVVITHDDKYFDLADRLLKLDFGKVIYEKDNRPVTLAPVAAL